jgi:hypothetical protein
MDYRHRMTEYRTVNEVVKALGGNQPVAVLTASTHKAVSNWRARNRLPSNTFLVIKTELVRLGVSAPDYLWSMRQPAPVKRRRDPARA